VWQALQAELADTNFQVISVAFESRGVESALPHIEAARPTYPCLIDSDHTVARLYGMLNVPTAVWIDEEGQIVRPPEPAGTTDSFRSMDRTTGKLPADDLANLRDTRGKYLDGLRDWARRGADSPWSLSAAEVRERTQGPKPEHAQARAHFQLGEYLWQHGHADLARAQFDEAIRLHPQSWAYKRQAWDLEEKGKAGGPEFWKAVEDLGATRYYPELELPRA